MGHIQVDKLDHEVRCLVLTFRDRLRQKPLECERIKYSILGLEGQLNVLLVPFFAYFFKRLRLTTLTLHKYNSQRNNVNFTGYSERNRLFVLAVKVNLNGCVFLSLNGIKPRINIYQNWQMQVIS